MNETRFTEDHEWARLEGDDVVTIGISDYAQEQLGELVHVELPSDDTQFDQGDEIAVVESVKAAGEVKTPVSGTIVDSNQELTDEPQLINQDASGRGWICQIKMSKPAEFAQLMDEDAYQLFIKEAS